ncbi:Nucleolar RNA helicase 2 [Porphyridium purpureum]|uniref:RNA helicase n=1 Tax=Porphyridium purpureum TaxID=35688 RepID=A0A5J4YPF5_PORPP|nr:Nucleolar RNA helicase 2 [Porphyridium purpureum]|eukprot:POR1928..scf295_9
MGRVSETEEERRLRKEEKKRARQQEEERLGRGGSASSDSVATAVAEEAEHAGARAMESHAAGKAGKGDRKERRSGGRAEEHGAEERFRYGDERADEEDRAMDSTKVAKDALALDRYDFSDITKRALLSKGISSLFDIQAATYETICAGTDVIGRARTGSGKTLAFVLPTVESIVKNNWSDGRRRGRLPLVIVLAPTRELALQVFRDFEFIAGAHGLSAACLYGGTPFGPQCQQLREGVDVIVGTPGRVIDHLERETLRISAVKFVVLDEADEMLSMGFQQDVEKILENATAEHQTLLFSATVPKWVKDLTHKYLQPGARTIDTVGEDKNRTNSDIEHNVIPCPPMARGDTLGDLVKVHAGTYGKSLVFCDTKRDANELAEHEKLVALGCAVLHGDIPQATRDATLDKYRSGKVRCLIATDVAARGLDIEGVDLVVQTHPPLNYETYIHRSGRTGRAGKKGVCVTFYSQREQSAIRVIEHKTGIKFKRAGPPQPKDIMRGVGEDAVKSMDNVHEENIDMFREAAQKIIKERGAEDALSAALACITGYTSHIKSRSLLSCFEGNTAMILTSHQGFDNVRSALGVLRRFFSAGFAGSVRGPVMLKDGSGIVFDLGEQYVKEVRDKADTLPTGLEVKVLESIPDLMENEMDIRDAEAQLRERKSFQRGKWGDKKGSGGGYGGQGGYGNGGSGGGKRNYSEHRGGSNGFQNNYQNKRTKF